MRCLRGLAGQTCPPVQLVVVARADDHRTLAALASSSIKHALIVVSEPGVVHALGAGLRSVDAHIVAFTDDDAVPRPDWISRILDHFADLSVGGVGGRDVISSAPSQPWSSRVGIVT